MIARDSMMRSLALALGLVALVACAPLTQGRCAHGNCTDGKGIYRWPGDRVYRGKFKDGQPHGQGRLENADGSWYEGGFEKGMFSGEGKLMSADGTLYEGMFKAHRKQGFGAEERKDGIKYWGDYVQDLWEGYGTLTVPGKLVYSGHFQKGLQHGHGIVTLPDGRKFEGRWEQGKMVEGEQAPDIPSLDSLRPAPPPAPLARP
jgi:hypothetical protein